MYIIVETKLSLLLEESRKNISFLYNFESLNSFGIRMVQACRICENSFFFFNRSMQVYGSQKSHLK